MSEKIVLEIVKLALKSPGTITFVFGSIKDKVIEYHVARTRRKLNALRKKFELEQKAMHQEEAQKILNACYEIIAKHSKNEEQTNSIYQSILANNDWINK